ncbi:MAG TPA: hypothetical protein VK034_10230 [Enhygromyxa sp.]|nr:hypothetical protein [Enhygromyxa sp.]
MPRAALIPLALCLALACSSEPDAAKPAQPVTPAAGPDGSAREVTPSGTTVAATVEGLVMQVPSEWTREDPANPGMRKAEFVLPGPGGEARLVVYRFPGGAGGAQANIDRWQSQIEPAAGAEAQTRELEVGGLTIAAIDSAGRFVGQSMPGAPPQPAIDDARLLAAAIEGSGDPFYLKLVGPRPTIDVWAPAWLELLGSLAVAP